MYRLGPLCTTALAAAAFAVAIVATAWAAPADVIRTPATEEARRLQVSPDDEQLLEEIQRGCFLYLWNEADPASGLVKDRRRSEVSSVAGVGFQLAALPIGVERKWVTREEAQQRALAVLDTLGSRGDNKALGVYLHFIDLRTAGPLPRGRSDIASTVDHSLLLAGAMTAAEYFGGEVAQRTAEMAAATNWKAFDVAEGGFLSMGWRPGEDGSIAAGEFVPARWHIASDEERLVYFLAAGAPREDFAGDPSDYYRLKRSLGRHGETPPFVMSWNGSTFTYFFSHCWIDYARFGADDPAQFGVDNPRVDWLENSRRAILTHRQRCGEAADQFGTLAPDRWGFAPCMGQDERGRPSYLVQELRPNLANVDRWLGGTVAPYAAGTSIMFTPAESLAALRAFRALKDPQGRPLVWRDPADGGYGLADSFNLDQPHVSDDHVAIDVGPMLVGIENFRTGLVWQLFMAHDVARRAVERLRLTPFGGAAD